MQICTVKPAEHCIVRLVLMAAFASTARHAMQNKHRNQHQMTSLPPLETVVAVEIMPRHEGPSLAFYDCQPGDAARMLLDVWHDLNPTDNHVIIVKWLDGAPWAMNTPLSCVDFYAALVDWRLL